MTSPSAAGLPIQPLSQAAVVNARIRQLMDQDLGDTDRAQQYADLLEDWARATCSCSTPVRAA
ncbi:hypothetical protein AB0387_20640 [Streptomyces sp. NPDC089173]|uniref:hypothetical protein n=1 Tax=Streptomyces sp. NPDC089173 TaxID=3154965 RepID=UPI00345062C9